MEPRKAELKITAEQRKDERKYRFQIMNLEERIAPTKDCSPVSCCENPQGHLLGKCK